ncbi:MAG: EAL domain-containing protein [Campylobacterales bacterium]|nr:EAL domain-containing protein [Campylobacterales bacterium]
MLYNILVIDHESQRNEYEKRFYCLEEYRSFFVDNFESLDNFPLDIKIHIVLLNTEIISSQVFLEHLFKLYDKKAFEIPILIRSESMETIEDTQLLVYDYINFTMPKNIFCNKIKFCHQLYKKELQHEENMQRILYVDGLTKLPNRAKLIQDIITNDNLISSLAIIDINDFKEINDFYGLRIGDSILRGVVEIVEETIQIVKDKVGLYKFSADVYCLANKGLDSYMFEEIVTYVLGAIDSKIFYEDDYEIDIKAKAGITFSSKKNKLITADIALQAAKKENKDYVVFYEELDTVNEYQNNMLWTKKLKTAIKNDKIVVYYQPLVNNHTLNVDKYECLVRMIDEEGKVISPFFFLEIAKKANLYKDITKIVIDKAFSEFANLSFEFSVNVSYEDINDKIFMSYVEEKLKKYGVAKKVTWEILEDEGVKDYDVLIKFIDKVKSLGCKVSIDDFGSGYSNFEHLLKMNVDYLKIDASLIKNVATDENSYKVVKTVIDFATSLKLKTIAEYVENDKIFDITKNLGTHYSQGYYFSAPIPKPNLYTFENKI